MPSCCREEWPAQATLEQQSSGSEEFYDREEVVIRIHGRVTFSWSGFENVMQTDENWIEIPGGLTSGDPTRSGSNALPSDLSDMYSLEYLRIQSPMLAMHPGIRLQATDRSPVARRTPYYVIYVQYLSIITDSAHRDRPCAHRATTATSPKHRKVCIHVVRGPTAQTTVRKAATPPCLPPPTRLARDAPHTSPS